MAALAIPAALAAAVALGLMVGSTAGSRYGIGLPAAATLLALCVVNPSLAIGAVVAGLIGHVSLVLSSVHGVKQVDLLLIGLLLAVAAFRVMQIRGRGILVTRSQLLTVAFLAVLAAATLQAVDVTVAIDRFYSALRDLMLLAALAYAVTSVRDLRWTVWAILSFGALLAALALFQGATGNFSQQFFGLAQVSRSHIVGEVNLPRVTGTFADPNAFGMYLLVFACLAIFRVWDERQVVLRVAGLAAFILCLGAILYTFSRGTIVALGLSLLLALRLRRLSPRLLLLGALVAVPVLIATPSYLGNRLLTLAAFLPGGEELSGEVSFRGRMSENLSGIEIFLDHPVLGAGPGNSAALYLEYASDSGLEFRRAERSIPNTFLEMAADLGSVGVIVFVTLIGSVMGDLRDAARRFRRHGDPLAAGYADSILVAIVAFLAASLFLPFAYPRGLWVLLALAIATARIASMTRPPSSAGRSVIWALPFRASVARGGDAKSGATRDGRDGLAGKIQPVYP